MKRLLQTTCMALVLFTLTAFKSDYITSTKPTLLVLTNTDNEDSFSKFTIVEENGVLIGYNSDDYPVKDGIYRIHASSNNKYYNHNILITK